LALIPKEKAMSKRTLPGAPEGRLSANCSFGLHPQVLARWNPGIRAAAAADKEEERTISIYDAIGFDYWTGEGVTAKRIAAALRSMGKGPVTVGINSPGGDFFEGLAIYNLLREHDGEITVKVLGLAASAASVVAMAGDKVQIGRAAFFMVHNSWAVVIGNRHDLVEAAEMLEPFDAAMAGIYGARTGQEPKAIGKLMDAESWIGGEAAVDGGFADELLPADQVSKSSKGTSSAAAARRIEAALRASGMPKSEAMRLISEFKAGAGDPAGRGEGDPAGRSAGDPPAAAADPRQLLDALRGFSLSK
jgi:ATP-dependent Clp protease protease subunit